MARGKWFDRKFSLDVAVSLYPNIVERLRGTPARIEDRLKSLPSQLLIRRHGERWSIQEHVGHLLDLEPLWMGRLEDFASNQKVLREADLQNRKTHEANHNSKPFNGILDAFRSSRQDLIQRLDSFDQVFVEKTAHHPRLNQEMRVVDMAFFIAEHDDHHLASITELIRLFTTDQK